MNSKKVSLENRTFIGSYQIKKVFLISKDSIVYIVEDMKTGQTFLLTELYPSVLVSRDVGETSFKILNSNLFEDLKKKFTNDSIKYYTFSDLNIMNTISTFEENGTVYSITLYNQEQTLKSYLTHKSLNDRDIVTLFLPLFRTLNILHGKGLLFKNLHPNNLFVNKKGLLVLGQISNQYPECYEPYSPIEQCTGLSDMKLTPKSDIYALGAILYEVLKGFPPVAAQTRKEDMENLLDDPYEKLKPSKGLNQDFCEFVNKSLSLNFKERPPSTAQLQSFCISSNQVNHSKSSLSTEEKVSESFSWLRMTGIFLIGIIAYGLLPQHNEKRISKDELSYFTITQYKWAALWGDSNAQNALGIVYEEGIKVDKNLRKAIEWYEKSADNGNHMALTNLARLKGQTGTKNNNLSTRIDQASKINTYTTTIDQINVAYYHFTEKNYKTAYGIFKELAKNNNNAYSMMFIGYMYTKGYGVEKNYYLASDWFNQAIKEGNGLASFYLGNLYWNGKGVKKDRKKAIALYKTSANKGVHRAMVALGKNHLKIAKQNKDYTRVEALEKARYWLTKADKAGSVVAKKLLNNVEVLESNRNL